MNQIFTDKEILGDGLAAQKASTSNYNLFSNECSHENVRNSMLHILAEEHDIQDDVFHMMSQRGFYPTPSAEAKKVKEARQRFESGATL
jgi:spore coat protein CotF